MQINDIERDISFGKLAGRRGLARAVGWGAVPLAALISALKMPQKSLALSLLSGASI